MSVFLAFDFGMKFIGVAVGQAITQTARPLMTLHARDGIPQWADITRLIEEWRPRAFLVGLPLQMDGRTQHMTVCSQRFANRLKERYQLPVHRVDERLTSWEAKYQQQEARYGQPAVRGKKERKEKDRSVHALAAAIMLEQWMRA